MQLHTDFDRVEIPIGTARLSDRLRLSEMYAADMRDLGADVTPAMLLPVVDGTLAEQGTLHQTWVARFQGEPVGALLAATFWSLKMAGKAMWIESLYVDPAHRRQGLGRRLVEHMLDWAEANGFKGVELEAYHMNTGASILYRSLGFRRLARERYCFEFGKDGA